MIKNSLAPFFLLLVISLAVAAPVAQGQTPGDELEKEAQNIDRMIMCPVCPAETIDQAQVEISFQMRAIIREMLAEGRTRDEILDFFVDRYGPDILAAPPKSGRNLLAWILPIVGVAIGLAGVFLVIRAMTNRDRSGQPQPAAGRRSDEPTHQAPPDPELAPYLDIVDRMLASRRSTGPAYGASTEMPQASSPESGPDFNTEHNTEAEESSRQDLPPDSERESNG